MIQRYSVISEANALKMIPVELFTTQYVIGLSCLRSSFQPLLGEFEISQKLLRGIHGKEADEMYELSRQNMEALYNQSSWKWDEKKESTC